MLMVTMVTVKQIHIQIRSIQFFGRRIPMFVCAKVPMFVRLVPTQLYLRLCMHMCASTHDKHTHTPIFIPMHMFAFTCLIYAGRIMIYVSTYHYLYLPINKHTNPLNGKLMILEFHSCCRQIYSYIMPIIYIQTWPF